MRLRQTAITQTQPQVPLLIWGGYAPLCVSGAPIWGASDAVLLILAAGLRRRPAEFHEHPVGLLRPRRKRPRRRAPDPRDELPQSHSCSLALFAWSLSRRWFRGNGVALCVCCTARVWLWPKAAVTSIRRARQLSGDKLPLAATEHYARIWAKAAGSYRGISCRSCPRT